MIQVTASRILQTVLATAFSLAMATASVALAQDNPFLSKAEVEPLTVGKTLKYARASDGQTMAYDVRDGGSVFHTTGGRRSVTVRGDWTIGDDGGLCIKWVNTDRYVVLQDGCFKFRRTGDKIQVFGARNPDTVIGDLVP